MEMGASYLAWQMSAMRGKHTEVLLIDSIDYSQYVSAVFPAEPMRAITDAKNVEPIGGVTFIDLFDDSPKIPDWVFGNWLENIVLKSDLVLINVINRKEKTALAEMSGCNMQARCLETGIVVDLNTNIKYTWQISYGNELVAIWRK